MHITEHIKARMSQRGISNAMVEVALQYGDINNDKTILGRKAAMRVLEKLQRQQQVLKKIIDKGGVVVVTEDDTLITTYNYQP
jgi:CTP-dependent riboflavin kinase